VCREWSKIGSKVLFSNNYITVPSTFYEQKNKVKNISKQLENLFLSPHQPTTTSSSSSPALVGPINRIKKVYIRREEDVEILRNVQIIGVNGQVTDLKFKVNNNQLLEKVIEELPKLELLSTLSDDGDDNASILLLDRAQDQERLDIYNKLIIR